MGKKGAWKRDIAGQRFGKLLVISFSHINSYGEACWHCKCDCGKETIKSGPTMRKGRCNSCGCQRPISVSKATRTHGMSGTKAYRAWSSMLQRCTNPNNPMYPLYGGRGIKVCKRWHKFENFLEDMGHPPKEKSLDRINNNGNYNKKNCRWSTQKEQCGNRRDNNQINFMGETKIVTEWAKELGIPRARIYHRLSRGWSIEETLTLSSPQNRWSRIKKLNKQ